MRTLGLAPLVLACIGCNDPTVAALAPDRSASYTQRFGAVGQREVDILFVVDSSGSMTEEQHGLSDAFPRFAGALAALSPLSWRLGVVTTDMGAFGFPVPGCPERGDDGELQLGGSDCRTVQDPWLWGDSEATNVPDGDVARELGCRARVGTRGCSFEMPLLAMERALVDHAPVTGFLRPSAALAVIVVSDEDDCSPRDASFLDPGFADLGSLTSYRCFAAGVSCDGEPMSPGPKSGCGPDGAYLIAPGDAAAILRKVKPGGEDRVVFAVIAGPAEPVAISQDSLGNLVLLPSCVSDFGSADPAVRLGAAADALGPGGLRLSLCDGDFEPALDAIGAQIGAVLDSRCLSWPPADGDAVRDGLQPACAVTAVARSLPACETSADGPCWQLVADPSCPSGLALDAPGDEVTISCQVAH